MDHPPADAIVVTSAYDDGQCDRCGKSFSRGLGIGLPTGELIVSLCMWCLLLAADDVTGHNHVGQELIWDTRKRYYRRIKELGWTGKVDRWRPKPVR